jgi:hypothetical protein
MQWNSGPATVCILKSDSRGELISHKPNDDCILLTDDKYYTYHTPQNGCTLNWRGGGQCGIICTGQAPSRVDIRGDWRQLSVNDTANIISLI